MLPDASRATLAVIVATPLCSSMIVIGERGSSMGMLMIGCPATGKEISTGIEMLRIDQLPVVTATLECPACGNVHRWTKFDAWLAESGDVYRQVAGNQVADDQVAGNHGAKASPRTISAASI